jgi:hypothetical protein
VKRRDVGIYDSQVDLKSSGLRHPSADALIEGNSVLFRIAEEVTYPQGEDETSNRRSSRNKLLSFKEDELSHEK